jgi:hypothetical protein
MGQHGPMVETQRRTAIGFFNMGFGLLAHHFFANLLF